MRELPTFGELLRLAREAHSLRRDHLEFDAELSDGYICRLENGKRTPTRKTVTRLAGLLTQTPTGEALMLAAAGWWPSYDGARLVVAWMNREED